MESQPKPREPYEPPTIQRIQIVPEELAAVGCKQIKGMGPTVLCATTPGGICKVPGS